ncbi:MAG: 50S ribosomal protein L24 [Nanobdellota archaeon]
MVSIFSNTWKKSTKVGKQRKYVYNAPFHKRSKFMSSIFSAEQRKKHGRRNASVRTGDKVKILRGQFKGKEGKVESVDCANARVYIEKIEQIKKDGTKTYVPIHPSNLMIIDAVVDDKKRFKSKESMKTGTDGGKND